MLRRIAILLSYLILFKVCLYAQYDVNVFVDNFNASDDIYITGSFNNWQAGNEKYRLKRINYFRSGISLHDLPAGKQSFKFTRGSWASVETDDEGREIGQREIAISGDTTIYLSVKNWKDLYVPNNNDSVQFVKAIALGIRNLNANFDTSLKYALLTMSYANRLKSQNLKAYALNLQGEVMLRLGNTQKALELYNEGLAIRKAMNDSGAIVFFHNQLGDAYWQMNDTVTALHHYRDVVQLAPDFVFIHPLHEILCNALNRIGTYYITRKQLDSAIACAERGSEIGDKLSASIDLLKGDIAIVQNNQNTAKQFYISGYDHALHINNNYLLAIEACEKMANAFKEQQQVDSAISYTGQACYLAMSIPQWDMISKTGQQMVALFKEKGLIDSALAYQQKIISVAATLYAQQKERQALNTYFSEQMNATQLAASERQFRNRLWMIALAAAIVLLLAGIILYRKRLQSNFRKKAQELEMQALRAQMNPHFIFNCLGSINKYIVKHETKEASGYLAKFAKLIRQILEYSTAQQVSLASELETLKLYLDLELMRFDQAFAYDIQVANNVDAENTMVPSMLVQPFVENAIWHGLLHKKQKGKLTITCKKISNKLLLIEVEDDGIGRRKAAEIKSQQLNQNKSFGMQISSDRIRLMNNSKGSGNAVEIEDLVNERNEAIGTKAKLTIQYT